jgi:peptidyl-dipeptidase Dcp
MMPFCPRSVVPVIGLDFAVSSGHPGAIHCFCAIPELPMSSLANASPATDNPLLTRWQTPFAMPPFAAIRPEHFMGAFEVAMARHLAEIEVIKAAPTPATFADTIVALERSGSDLERVAAVFFNLAGADTNDALQAIEREIGPRLAAHGAKIGLDPVLFSRIDDLFSRREALGLDPEQARVLERTHTRFVRSGARLEPAAKARVAELSERLASLGVRFSQNVLADERAWRMVIEDPRDLEGLSAPQIAAAAEAARAAGLEGRHLITLARSSVEPFLQASARRHLREQAFRAWAKRGENGGETDNRAVIVETLAARKEHARLLGYDTFADYRLADSMAGSAAAASALLEQVWAKAVVRAGEERALLEAEARRTGENHAIEPWDWRYWAERVRKARYDLDDGEVKPYLQLDRVLAAAFEVAGRLFGLTFTERPELPRYHPDVRTWEVTDFAGRHVGVFMGDYFARPSKRSGAWMSAYRRQHKLEGGPAGVRPVIVNVASFAKAAEGRPTLLSLDDARTLFHELGHGLHGLLSDVTYPSIAGTAVARDFVELPSQLFEHWLTTPEILSRFAVHYETGAPMPADLLARIRAARNFNQGFATVEYVSCAIADLAIHAADPAGLNVDAFERATLARLAMPAGIVMRHRFPHFQHLFSGGGYAAGYYSYMWSEVMDADAFSAFEEAGDVFDPALSARLAEHIYAAGNRRDPKEAYIAFRGRLPTPDALLAKRGLAREAASV